MGLDSGVFACAGLGNLRQQADAALRKDYKVLISSDSFARWRTRINEISVFCIVDTYSVMRSDNNDKISDRGGDIGDQHTMYRAQ